MIKRMFYLIIVVFLLILTLWLSDIIQTTIISKNSELSKTGVILLIASLISIGIGIVNMMHIGNKFKRK